MDLDNDNMNKVLFEKHHNSDLDGMMEIYCQKTNMANKVNSMFPNLLYEKCKAGLSDCFWLKYYNRG